MKTDQKTGSDSRPIIRVSNFKKSYSRTQAVRGIDLEVMPGEIYGLIGPDGAGKSTLMKALAGVLEYDSGLVEVFGIPVKTERDAEKIKAGIGFMPQGLGLNLYPELSIEENIDFFAHLRLVSEHDLESRKNHLLAMTRLDRFRNRPMKNLSGGMKQKLGLICSLIHEPDLIILDEPTTGVDPVSRRDFWAILASLIWERGMTALVSTAYMEEASRFHKISLMHEGKILTEGYPDEIVSFVPGVMASVIAEPELEAFSILKKYFGNVQTLGKRLKVFIREENFSGVETRIREIIEGNNDKEAAGKEIRINEINTCEPDLEDIFLQLVGKENTQPETVDFQEINKNKDDILSCSADNTHNYNDNNKKINSISENTSERSEPVRETAIEANCLTRDFGDFRAVDNVSFRVPYGEIFGLLGANGAG
jgi:ABC-2 type transport system ATP-binding protein